MSEDMNKFGRVDVDHNLDDHLLFSPDFKEVIFRVELD